MRPLRLLPLLTLLLPLVLTSGCSIKQIALNAVADELSGGTGGSFTNDPDLQFIGEALPFGLKLMEGINDGVPEHVAMKLTLASGFTQYAAVYVEWPAERRRHQDADHAAADQRSATRRLSREAMAPEGHTVRSATSALCKLHSWWTEQASDSSDSGSVSGARLLHHADWIAFLLHGEMGVTDHNNALKLGFDPAGEGSYPSWLSSAPYASTLPTRVLPPGTRAGTVASAEAPLFVSIASRGGSPRATAVPATVPRRKVRRLSGRRLEDLRRLIPLLRSARCGSLRRARGSP